MKLQPLHVQKSKKICSLSYFTPAGVKTSHSERTEDQRQQIASATKALPFGVEYLRIYEAVANLSVPSGRYCSFIARFKDLARGSIA